VLQPGIRPLDLIDQAPECRLDLFDTQPERITIPKQSPAFLDLRPKRNLYRAAHWFAALPIIGRSFIANHWSFGHPVCATCAHWIAPSASRLRVTAGNPHTGHREAILFVAV
jgi:hypothetical protein